MEIARYVRRLCSVVPGRKSVHQAQEMVKSRHGVHTEAACQRIAVCIRHGVGEDRTMLPCRWRDATNRCANRNRITKLPQVGIKAHPVRMRGCGENQIEGALTRDGSKDSLIIEVNGNKLWL